MLQSFISVDNVRKPDLFSNSFYNEENVMQYNTLNYYLDNITLKTSNVVFCK